MRGRGRGGAGRALQRGRELLSALRLAEGADEDVDRRAQPRRRRARFGGGASLDVRMAMAARDQEAGVHPARRRRPPARFSRTGSSRPSASEAYRAALAGGPARRSSRRTSGRRTSRARRSSPSARRSGSGSRAAAQAVGASRGEAVGLVSRARENAPAPLRGSGDHHRRRAILRMAVRQDGPAAGRRARSSPA